MEERLPAEDASALERHLEIGKEILERIRSRTNNNTGYFENWDDEDLFSAIYLTPRTAAVPDLILSEPLTDVRAMFAQVFGGIREALAVDLGWEESVWVVVDASVDDTTTIVCTDGTLLLLHREKPWRFWWRDEKAMAGDLGRWYEAAATRLLDERRQRTTNHGATRT